MTWIILAAVGVPLWLCSIAIVVLVLRNRKLRARSGNIRVRRRLAGKARWQRGHGVWVHDVFAYRRSPAGWAESLTWVTSVSTRAVVNAAEAKKLRRLGEGLVLSVMTDDDGMEIEFASRAEDGLDLLGPFAVEAAGRPREART
jgi:hypothetical protein